MNVFIRAVFAALLALAVGVAGAQDMGLVVRISYYIAADADGVGQVYQLALGGQEQPRQITHAQSDVITFGAAYDGLSIAYISGGQLWLQPIHMEDAEALASVSAEQFFSGPVFSQDGEYIAYPDDGVWLYDLGARETRQLLANVPLEAFAANAGDFRLFQPERFVPGPDGKAAKLIVDVGVWEWNTAGVYDLATGVFQELEGQLHTDILPLYGERVLLYGNGGVAGEPALHFAESLDDINAAARIVDFASLTDATLFAERAVELHPGLVRVSGSTIGQTPDEVTMFYLDVDLMSGTVGEVNFVNLSKTSSGITVAGAWSPDGSLLPVYLDALWTDAGSIYGSLYLLDVETGETVAADFPETVSIFRWQP